MDLPMGMQLAYDIARMRRREKTIKVKAVSAPPWTARLAAAPS
jgi:hypothetical protein